MSAADFPGRSPPHVALLRDLSRAWKLGAQGQAAEAGEILARLREQEPESAWRHEKWKLDYREQDLYRTLTVALLAHNLEGGRRVDKDAFRELAERILDSAGRVELIKRLPAQEHRLARELAEGLGGDDRAAALLATGATLVFAPDRRAEARQLFLAARETASSRVIIEIAREQARAGEYADAEETARGRIGHREALSEYGRAPVLEAIALQRAAAQARDGDIAAAGDSARAIANRWVRGQAWTEIAVCQGEARQWDAALETLNQVSADPLQIRSRCKLAAMMAESGERSRALEILEADVDRLKEQELSWGVDESIPGPLGEIAKTLARMGRRDEARAAFTNARSLLPMISRAHEEIDCWVALIAGQIEVGEYEDALTLYHRPRGPFTLLPREILWSEGWPVVDALRHLARLGDAARALELHSLVTDRKTRIKGLLAIAEEQDKMADPPARGRPLGLQAAARSTYARAIEAMS